MKDVTMRDIAKELNISAVSVSKALTGKDGVSDAVRETVIKKATEMGYQYSSKPSEARHYNFGVMVSQSYISDSAFYSKLFQSIAIECGKKQHSCTLEILTHRDEREGTLPGNVAGNRMDGVIVLGPISEKCMEKVIRMDTPFVLVDNSTALDRVDCIVSDGVYGAHMLTDYLIRKGHKKIAYVGSIEATNSIMDRYLGYAKGLLMAGIPLRDDYLIPDRGGEDAYLIDIRIPKDLPDAFVCNCDEVAYHLVEQLTEKGIRVPEDVSVVGFDDYIFATLSKPQLTTFRVDMEAMGRLAAELIEKKMEHPHDVSGRHVVAGDIIIRDSVKDRR